MISEPRQPDQQGDIEKRIKDLHKEHHHFLFCLLRKEFGARYAEDALQEAWLRFHEYLKCHQEPEDVRSYLVIIAIHEAIGYYRKNGRPHESLDELDDPNSVPTTDPWPDFILDADLKRILQSLSAEHREVVEMHIIQKISLKEISEITRINEGTVRTRWFRAEKKLNKILKGYLNPE